MSRKFPTPEQLANQRSEKKSFALYLDVSAMDYLKVRASDAGISLSQLINEVILSYVEEIKQQPSNKKSR